MFEFTRLTYLVLCDRNCFACVFTEWKGTLGAAFGFERLLLGI